MTEKRRDSQHAVVWEERALGNIFIRKMKFKYAGDFVDGHAHNFDHTTIIFTGAVEVAYKRPNGETGKKIFRAPQKGGFCQQGDGFVLIPADHEHHIVALEDFTEAWCVFAHRDEHGEVVNSYNGIDQSYGLVDHEIGAARQRS